MDTVFKGEHLLPGQLGQFFVVLAFGAALLSTIAYFFAANDINKLDKSWQRIGRIGFWLNTTSVIGIGVCLFYIIYNHFFEYHYAYAHSSRSLPVYYIISSFWEGQEGSFWLWTFWQAVLGNLLIWRAKSWESPVLAVISVAQVLLSSFLLGVEIFGARIGSSPFILLRDALELPFLKRPDYLAFVRDGNGLSPLLQNYWMVIHPPTLFLGFASMIIPFAYGIAGLWQKRYKEWVGPAISYSLFAVMVLGTGIIMGSFWAYESLNFGGFWAWDPVENASVIPWLTLIGAVHVLIVFKNSGHAYFTALFLTLISFVLVLYASYLTRSGVLGETSVHAFTDLGMNAHLIIDVLVFLVIAVVAIVARWKELPFSQKEEETYSREFWLFVGSVFLALSCLQLVAVTSIPVFNAVFGTKVAPPNEPVTLYNIFQGAFAVVVALFMGFTQFLKYKKTEPARFLINAGAYLLSAILIGGVVVWLTGVYKLHTVYSLLTITAIYAVLSNGKVLADALKGKLKLAGSAVAHIGFGLLLIGAMISAGTSKVVSENATGEMYSEEFAKANNPRENIMLYKNQPVQMGEYEVTYTGDSIALPNHYFKVDYKKKDAQGKVTEQFTLTPNSQANRKMGLVSSPDTKHYLFHDLYTHVSMAPIKYEDELRQQAGGGDDGHDAEQNDDSNYDAPVPHQVAIGDTIRYREGFMILKALARQTTLQSIKLKADDVAVGAELEITTHGKVYKALPVYLIRGNNGFDFAKKVEDAGLKLRLTKIIPKDNKVEITVYQQPESKKQYIVMRAIMFPYINFFWSGTIIMVIGFLMSIFRRNKELKTV
ncbi:cytochrome c biogenesis protein CcsA [Mucilaginibacter myungsuensis]|uniref:Cytochrome c biogenesis protein CcsA n=1 Tax=Mucilaginibacter myungsuensis TaxID=649104 RepID=A0A929KW02_9SPHI|nr:cytochrome c biogenesis protein CcsA [Mucilaginibacter myungsuensis]MBE9660923.1 cytochrome c biogenesis protein CcsA [Mucilaginibacter myungsuensis]MDN3600969.1 cytochrome c biogenesis protein CcsA [Mucilaginibacter myungsuensis]